MKKLIPIKLVTIIALDTLEGRLIADLKACGIKGYTISEAEGEGIQSRHFTDWEGRNMRIETLVPEHIADRIFTLLEAQYFDKYSIVAFVSDVKVLRKERFTDGNEN